MFMKQLDRKPKIGAHPAVEADGAFSKGRREGPGNPSVPESWETETHTGQKPSSVLDRGDESPGTREGGTLRYQKSSCHRDLEAASPSTECPRVTGSNLLCVLASSTHRVWRTRHPAREKRGDPGLPGSSEPSGQWGSRQFLVLGSGMSPASECVVCLLWVLVAF